MKTCHPEGTGIRDSFSLELLEEQLFAKARTPAAVAISQIADEIAPTLVPVLLEGEAGTGKEILALRIHRLSQQSSGPFAKVVATHQTPESIQQLFGGGNGEWATSGASHTGTIFLDHIDDLDPGCQLQVTRVVSEWGLRGGSNTLGPRLIASTVRNLENEVRLGAFREDLYYRINIICLRLPPLRHRREDLPALVNFFLSRHGTMSARALPTLSPETLKVLVEYKWPGNLWELERIVRKIIESNDEHLRLAELASLESGGVPSPDRSQPPSLKAAARRASRQAERKLILRALERTRWNRKRAARELQISYKALLYKLKQIGMGDETEEMNSSEGFV